MDLEQSTAFDGDGLSVMNFSHTVTVDMNGLFIYLKSTDKCQIHSIEMACDGLCVKQWKYRNKQTKNKTKKWKNNFPKQQTSQAN